MGVHGVKTIRSTSMFGFSMIFIIFEEKLDFYWTRSRILEKLNSLPAGILPAGVQPMLGPDATALGQIFWYTLEGRDPDGQPTGGWALHELRTVQDWFVRYHLLSAEGIAEVAPVGGFVQEYQVDVDPDAMRAWDVSLEDVFSAVRQSNLDVGARQIEKGGPCIVRSRFGRGDRLEARASAGAIARRELERSRAHAQPRGELRRCVLAPRVELQHGALRLAQSLEKIDGARARDLVRRADR